MRWGGASNFVWVRPLRRIVCLLDGAVVPFDLRDGEDDGHGLASGDLTEGHRFHAPGAFAVASCARLGGEAARAPRPGRRRRTQADHRATASPSWPTTRQVTLVDDPGLLDEVAGLVEWPVPLLGRIDDAYMDLPAEVRQVSMRVNQRYFAFRNADGSAAPYFGFVANIEPADGGATSIAGNERVLRARFADARHFWDLDRKARLESRVPLLDHVTFHAKLGSQGERVRRLERLAEEIAPLVGAGPALARDAARLAKADLVTGMVGEFPELQGVMGRYYALHDGEDPLVADAIRDHYAPKGPADAVPTADGVDRRGAGRQAGSAGGFLRHRRATDRRRRPVCPAPRRAGHHPHHPRERPLDRLAAGDRPGGAGLPSSRRASGSRRRRCWTSSPSGCASQLRAEGRRHDVLAAVFAAGADDVIPRLLSRTERWRRCWRSDDGANLLTAYRRAANILRIESRKDGPHDGAPSEDRLQHRRGTRHCFARIADADEGITACLRDDDYETALGLLANLRSPLDAFFDKVTVNAPEPELRLNRLRLLHKVRSTMDRIADFSKIEG